MRKIVLLCAAGLSTSVLVTNMRKAALAANLEYEINAYPVSSAKTVAKDADCVLLGPQVRFNVDKVRSELPGIPVESIDMRNYGMMDGAAVIKRVREIVGD
jgi:PTS system cellobiose-specific IIB component